MPVTVILFFKVNPVSDEQPLKASPPMDVTLAGIYRSVRLVHPPLNRFLGMDVTPSTNVIFSSPLPENGVPESFVMLDRMVISFRFVAFGNADCPIVSSVVGRSSSESLEHPL